MAVVQVPLYSHFSLPSSASTPEIEAVLCPVLACPPGSDPTSIKRHGLDSGIARLLLAWAFKVERRSIAKLRMEVRNVVNHCNYSKYFTGQIYIITRSISSLSAVFLHPFSLCAVHPPHLQVPINDCKLNPNVFMQSTGDCRSIAQVYVLAGLFIIHTLPFILPSRHSPRSDLLSNGYKMRKTSFKLSFLH